MGSDDDKNSEDDDDDDSEEESLGKVLTKKGKEIDRKSAGNVKRSKEEAHLDPEEENEFGYTESKRHQILRISKFNKKLIECFCLEKIKKRYGNLSGQIVRVKMTRTNSSLGIALAGHRNRNEMGCFIAGINPKGAIKSLNFKVGDEILEVIKKCNSSSN